jgi:hypothetical protein
MFLLSQNFEAANDTSGIMTENENIGKPTCEPMSRVPEEQMRVAQLVITCY